MKHLWFDIRQNSEVMPPAINPILLTAVLTIAIALVLMGAAAVVGLSLHIIPASIAGAAVVMISSVVGWWRDRVEHQSSVVERS